MLNKLKDIAFGAGEILLENYQKGNLETIFKEVASASGFSRQDPVTIADKQADAYIRQKVLSIPNVKVVTEECDETPSDYGGIVIFGDPLDSTRSFREGKDSFSIVLGAALDGVPMWGVVYIPAREEIYFATKGKGAYFQSFKNGDNDRQRIKVSSTSDLAESCLILGNDMGKDKKRFSTVLENLTHSSEHKDGSAGIRICKVAQGLGDTYLHPSDTISQWDTAGAQVVLEEAGGRISNVYGGPLFYSPHQLQHINGVVASNGLLHDDLIKNILKLEKKFNPDDYNSGYSL